MVFLAMNGGKLVHDAAVYAAIVVFGALAYLCKLHFGELIVVEQVVDGKSEAALEGGR